MALGQQEGWAEMSRESWRGREAGGRAAARGEGALERAQQGTGRSGRRTETQALAQGLEARVELGCKGLPPQKRQLPAGAVSRAGLSPGTSQLQNRSGYAVLQTGLQSRRLLPAGHPRAPKGVLPGCLVPCELSWSCARTSNCAGDARAREQPPRGWVRAGCAAARPAPCWGAGTRSEQCPPLLPSATAGPATPRWSPLGLAKSSNCPSKQGRSSEERGLGNAAGGLW